MSRLFDPLEQQRERARGLAAHMRGIPLADAGPCADCRHAGPRRRYGPVLVCAPCAERRLGAAQQVLDETGFAELLRFLAGDPPPEAA